MNEFEREHEVAYQQWLASRREPPQVDLDARITESLRLDSPPLSLASPLSPASTLRFTAIGIMHAAVLSAAVMLCIARLCLVIFPFSELH